MHTAVRSAHAETGAASSSERFARFLDLRFQTRVSILDVQCVQIGGVIKREKGEGTQVVLVV